MHRNMVVWPAVETFDICDYQEKMHKVLEECSEVFAAWQKLHHGETDDPKEMIDEAADLVQALSNLINAYGCDDMRQPMFECHERNKERGRYSNPYSVLDDGRL